MRTSASPRMPCSGLNSAARVTPGAFASRSIVLTPSRDRPVWLVSRPTRLPRSRAKFSPASTSTPVSTGSWAARGAELSSPRSARPEGLRHGSSHEVVCRQQRRGCDGRHLRAQRRHVAFAVRVHAVGQEDHVALRARSSHSDVPVNPVWPKEPIGNSSPRFEEYGESMSQPSPRTARISGGVDGGSSARWSPATESARRQAGRRRAASGRSATGPRRC